MSSDQMMSPSTDLWPTHRAYGRMPCVSVGEREVRVPPNLRAEGAQRPGETSAAEPSRLPPIAPLH